ncbi:hypothetical protein LshimejAT787_0408910 [Lyophyllum shimeji]|uniref:Uncharacterized protein n=1 Tax=Lyophyllum shimeji TaxID=47721 RepID=A0A9P3UNH0_LYOSH|nr:hypothetical protein LshimejAT787_0408910 [Lyophyllum shimeji]
MGEKIVPAGEWWWYADKRLSVSRLSGDSYPSVSAKLPFLWINRPLQGRTRFDPVPHPYPLVYSGYCSYDWKPCSLRLVNISFPPSRPADLPSRFQPHGPAPQPRSGAHLNIPCTGRLSRTPERVRDRYRSFEGILCSSPAIIRSAYSIYLGYVAFRGGILPERPGVESPPIQFQEDAGVIDCRSGKQSNHQRASVQCWHQLRRGRWCPVQAP